MPEFKPFNQFRDQIHDASLGEEVDRRFPEVELEGVLPPGGKSRSARRDAFAEELDKMLAYLRRFYPADGAASHTFQDGGGNFVDCIPFSDVPTVRAARQEGRQEVTDRAPAPKGFEPRPEKRGLERPPTPTRLVSPLRQGAVDRFNRRVACPDGCVPVARVTTDDIARAGTFENFFSKLEAIRKGKKGGAKKPAAKSAAKPAAKPRSRAKPPVAPAAVGHQYATVRDGRGGPYYGCSAGLGVWRPSVPSATTSISQLWMVGQRMGNGNPQTVESGWFVYPQFTGTNSPVLFVYFNPDGYIPVETGGRSGYVTNAQTQGFIPFPDSPFVINQQGFLIPTEAGGNPAAVQLYWEFLDAPSPGWYLFHGDVGQNPAEYAQLGYFPAYLYGATELATHCRQVQFGGEVGGLDRVARGTPPGFTEMGSGSRPTSDPWFNYRNVAFQCDTYVHTGGANMVRAQLVEHLINRPNFELDFPADPAFASYFFFGGGQNL